MSAEDQRLTILGENGKAVDLSPEQTNSFFNDADRFVLPSFGV